MQLDDPAKDFEVIAAGFCNALETGAIDLRGLLQGLVEIVRGALQLPDLEVADEAIEDPPGLHADCLAVATNVSRLVGSHQGYWEVFDPRVEEPPVAGSLVDDLSDIYRDLRRGLHYATIGRPIDAVWDWRFNFETHWGNHATDAIRVLHRVVAD